MMTFSNI